MMAGFAAEDLVAFTEQIPRDHHHALRAAERRIERERLRGGRCELDGGTHVLDR